MSGKIYNSVGWRFERSHHEQIKNKEIKVFCFIALRSMFSVGQHVANLDKSGKRYILICLENNLLYFELYREKLCFFNFSNDNK
jgi:hypothetical protein